LAGLKTFIRNSFTEHGECDEGIGYWAYGMRFASLGWSRLQREEFEDNVDAGRLRQVAEYPRKVHLFGNHFYSGNDGGLRANAQTEFIPWLSSVTGSAFLADWSRRHPAHGANHFGQMLRTLAAPESLPSESLKTEWRAAERASLVEDQQVAILRAPSSRGELLAVLTGGHNAERHNHNDLGHFVVALGDEIIVPDLGAPVYRADFFGPRRYTYVTASSRGHCCPLIEDHEQRPGTEAAGKVLEWSPEGDTPRFVLDLTKAYPAEAGLLEWKRCLECRPPDPNADRPAQMVVTDVFRTKQPNQRITHVLWSYSKPESHDEFHVPQGGVRFLLGSLFCEFSPSPSVVGKDEVDTRELLLRTEGKLYRLNALYRTGKQGELKIETRFFALQ
jgi:hypothetical protein